MRVALAIAVLGSACYAPQLERCAVRCNFGDTCPADMVCGGDHHCHPENDPPTCPGTTTGTWELVQVKSATGAGSTLSATLDAVTGGDLLVVAAHVDEGTTVTGISDDAPGGSSIYTRIPASHAKNSSDMDAVELWYAPAAAAGATRVTFTTDGTSDTIVVWELATERSAMPDRAAALSDQAASVTPVSPLITTGHAGEVVIAVGVAAGAITGLHAGDAFTNDALASNNGWGHLTDAHAPPGSYQAHWSSELSTFCSSAVAFVVAP